MEVGRLRIDVDHVDRAAGLIRHVGVAVGRVEDNLTGPRARRQRDPIQRILGLERRRVAWLCVHFLHRDKIDDRDTGGCGGAARERDIGPRVVLRHTGGSGQRSDRNTGHEGQLSRGIGGERIALGQDRNFVGDPEGGQDVVALNRQP